MRGLCRPEQGGGKPASLHGPTTLGGLLPLVEAKGGPLVKNIDIVKFEMGPTFPIWPGPVTSFARAWLYVLLYELL